MTIDFAKGYEFADSGFQNEVSAKLSLEGNQFGKECQMPKAKSDGNAQNAVEQGKALPQVELVEKAWIKGHPEHPGSDEEFKEASKLFQQAVDMTSKVDLVSLRSTAKELSKLLDATENDDVARSLVVVEEVYKSVYMSRYGYARMLSAYGEDRNDPDLRKKAMENLKDIERMDPELFKENSDLLGSYLQLARGGWIDQSRTAVEAYSYLGIKALNLPSPAEKDKEAAVDLLSQAILSHPEIAESRVNEALKDLDTTSSDILKAVYQAAAAKAEQTRKDRENRGN
ncbi:MAG: hypothetical protein K2X27_10990 [Candidatus Obscuribacterales bacterium]|nr:hypothetical protein [Candidatus Obscuribacterales bacterium]